MIQQIYSSRWANQTANMIRNRPQWVSLSNIAEDAKINLDWLAKFTRGQIPNASIERVNELHDYLNKQEWVLKNDTE